MALKAGTDMNCENYSGLRQSYLQGLVAASDIRRAAGRVLEHKFRLGVLDPPPRVPFSSIPSSVIGAPYHKLKAVQAAQKGAPANARWQRLLVTFSRALIHACEMGVALCTNAAGIHGDCCGRRHCSAQES